VPSTPIGRALGFAGMGASLLLGTLKDNIVGSFSSPGKDSGQAAGGGGGGGGGGGSFSIITESNAERLAAALCRMRGAALKLGQMLSIQDEAVLPPQVGRPGGCLAVRAGASWGRGVEVESKKALVWRSRALPCTACLRPPWPPPPPLKSGDLTPLPSQARSGRNPPAPHSPPPPAAPTQIQAALERVRQGADVMPRAQLEGQLRSQLGRDWASQLEGGRAAGGGAVPPADAAGGAAGEQLGPSAPRASPRAAPTPLPRPPPFPQTSSGRRGPRPASGRSTRRC
jgi:hypothetical protein